MACRSVWMLSAVLFAGFFCRAQTPSADLRGLYVYTNDLSQITNPTANALMASLNVPGVDGVAVVIAWSAIEPAIGQYQWATLDQWINASIAAGKKIDLVIPAGISTPSWLFQASPPGAGATALNFTVSPHQGLTGVCDAVTLAAPWDQAFLSQWDAMLAAVSAHLKSAGTYNSITMVRLTGVNRTTEETRLPAETAAITGLACVSDAISTWQQAGYKPSLVEQGWTSILGSFQKSFPDKSFSVSLIPTSSGFPPIGESGSVLTGNILDLTQVLMAQAAQQFPGKLVVQFDTLLPGAADNGDVLDDAQNLGTIAAWQTNEYLGNGGAACAGPVTSPVACTNDTFLALLEAGIYPMGTTNALRGQYIEAFHANVTAFPGATLQAHTELFAPIVFNAAHSADGNGFQTTFLLVNKATASASYTLRLDDSNGAIPASGYQLLSGSLTGTIAPGQSTTIETAGLGAQTQQGWAELTAPPSIGGSVIYSQKTSLPTLQEGTANIASVNDTDFFVPFDNTSGAVTSMAITNPNATSATISVTLRYSSGISESVTYPALPARAHQAFTIKSQFPNSTNQSGVAEFVSSVPVSVVAFRFNSTGAFTAFDAVPSSGDSVSITRTIPHAADGRQLQD